MLEKLLKMYVMAMATGVTSPMPHMVGPPGSGKSTFAQQLADLVGTNLRSINLSRLSPLELEGVQMPKGQEEKMRLELLHATIWTQIEEGDVVIFDECMRAFPEVFNGLLDILTSREVSGYKIPRAFFIGASNSVTSYDKALDDRLLHLPVADPRKRKAEKRRLGRIIIDALGLMPSMLDSQEMSTVLEIEVLPMFEVLDHFKGGATTTPNLQGTSVRKLIGQAQLREVESRPLRELLDWNNSTAMRTGKQQFVLHYGGGIDRQAFKTQASSLVGNEKLTKIQALNLDLNLQLVEMEELRSSKEGSSDDDNIFDDDVPF